MEGRPVAGPPLLDRLSYRSLAAAATRCCHDGKPKPHQAERCRFGYRHRERQVTAIGQCERRLERQRAWRRQAGRMSSDIMGGLTGCRLLIAELPADSAKCPGSVAAKQ